MKLGRIPRKNEVYKEFRAYHNVSGLTIRDLCQDIYSFAKYYTYIVFRQKCRYTVLKSLYGAMKAIRMEVAYPFLLESPRRCRQGVPGRQAFPRHVPDEVHLPHEPLRLHS